MVGNGEKLCAGILVCEVDFEILFNRDALQAPAIRLVGRWCDLPSGQISWRFSLILEQAESRHRLLAGNVSGHGERGRRGQRMFAGPNDRPLGAACSGESDIDRMRRFSNAPRPVRVDIAEYFWLYIADTIDTRC